MKLMNLLPLFMNNEAFSIDFRALSMNNGAFSIDFRALSMNNGAFSIDFRALSINNEARLLTQAIANKGVGKNTENFKRFSVCSEVIYG